MVRILPLASDFAMAACTSLVPSTVAHLAALSPLDSDPKNIEIALILPTGLQVPEGSAVLTIAVRRSDTNATLRQDSVLQQLAGAATPAVPRAAHASVYRLSAADAEKLVSLQATLQELKRTTPEGVSVGQLSLTIGGCASGSGPATDARASAFLTTRADGEFLPLFKDVPLRQLLGPAVFDAIGTCRGPS